VLAQLLAHAHPDHAMLKEALGRDWKGKLSLALYLSAVGLAFVEPVVSCAIYVLVAVTWLIPDRRIERKLKGHAPAE
jgi:cobalamin synthase